MRRKNSFNQKDTVVSSAIPAANTSLYNADKEKNKRTTASAASSASVTSTTLPSTSKTIISSSTSVQKRKIPKKVGFFSWFDRNDTRQIKKVEYNNNHSSLQNRGRRQHIFMMLLRDIVYLFLIGVVCIGLSSFIIGIHHLIASSSTTTTNNYISLFSLSSSSSPFYTTTRKIIVKLPLNMKIPRDLVKESVQRRPQHQEYLYFPILIQEFLHEERSNDSKLTINNTNNAEFHYPEIAANASMTHQEKENQQQQHRFYYPNVLNDDDPVSSAERKYKDYGSVDLRFVTQEGQSRHIYRELWENEGRARRLDQPRDDDVEYYYATDDDRLRNPYTAFDDDHIHNTYRCRRVNWTRKSFPTANLLHELDLVRNVPKFVGDGFYREVFEIEHPVLDKVELMVLKVIRFELDMMYDEYEYVRVDALVTERMSSNNQIVSMYGFGGYSMLTEYFSDGDVEDDIVMDNRDRHFRPLEEAELVTRNNFTGSQKLKLALSMVEPVAALHNFKDGVIVHDDIQLSQYLWTDETKTNVKLNDFNRAEVLFWDEEHEEYCRYRNGKGHGDWRAPEEYRNDPLTEKIDVWSLCNNFFSLLTGYYPFPHIESFERIRRKLSKNVVPEVDRRFHERSFAESKLVEIIESCYVPNADYRPDINEIQQMLLKAIDEEQKRQNVEAGAFMATNIRHSTADKEGDEEAYHYSQDLSGDEPSDEYEAEEVHEESVSDESDSYSADDKLAN